MKYKMRVFAVLFVLFLCWLFLKDTIEWYFVLPESERDLIALSTEEIEKLAPAERDKVIALKQKRKGVISLGLDLQGGLYMVLSVNDELLDRYLVERYTDILRQGKFKGKEVSEEDFKKALDAEIARNRAQEKEQVALSAFNRIGNRVDQFGISEPLIQKGADNRIYISLAGIKDPQAAEEIVSKAGRLTFQLYDQETQNEFVNKYGKTKPEYFVNVGTDRRPEWRIANELEMPKDFKLSPETQLAYFWEKDQYNIPKKKGGVFLKSRVLLEGKHVRHAQPQMDQYSSRVDVAFTLDDEGGAIFADVTGAHKGKHMAIVLDGKVQSYPTIQSKIPNGRGVITGNFTLEEAKNLSAILNAGSFNVGLKIEEKRTVGPSLGRDSVNMGMTAMLVGLGLVLTFMLVVYRFSGFIANLTLTVNLVILAALMTPLGATLTLPGIAGILLSLAMAVDANVIIYERIREESKNWEVPVRVAIHKGFDRAFTTIFDSNLTTVIAGLVLMQFGEGAIKGFAVTLVIGISASMFTALFLTRLMLDASVSMFKLKKLSI